MLDLISKTINKPYVSPSKPTFLFELSDNAAKKNWEELQKFQNLGEAISAQQDSPLGYGSEFRSSTDLKPIFHLHPLWPRLKSILDNGFSFPLEPLSAEIRRKDLLEGIKFGNHKGSAKHKSVLNTLVEKDVKYGYSLVLPLGKIENVSNTLIAPMNVM